MPQAADHVDLVLLELHPGAASVAEAASRERVHDVGGRDLDMGGQPLEDGNQSRAVGLSRREPTQHAASLSRRAVGVRDSVQEAGDAADDPGERVEQLQRERDPEEGADDQERAERVVLAGGTTLQ